jgi:hypothetical protein
MDQKIQNMISECKRQEESCLYTSVTLFEWLKSLRFWRAVFVIVPIVLGALAAAPILAGKQNFEWFTAICAMLAGILPAIYKGLDLDVSLQTIADSAHSFKVLQDRFRQAWSVTAHGSAEEYSTQFQTLMDRMDAARSISLTAPEHFFEKAKKKIEAGHYRFEADN